MKILISGQNQALKLGVQPAPNIKYTDSITSNSLNTAATPNSVLWLSNTIAAELANLVIGAGVLNVSTSNASNLVITGNATNVIIDTALSVGGVPGGLDEDFQWNNTGSFAGAGGIIFDRANSIPVANNLMLFNPALGNYPRLSTLWLRTPGDSAHQLRYDMNVDGVYLCGFSGGQLGMDANGTNAAITWNIHTGNTTLFQNVYALQNVTVGNAVYFGNGSFMSDLTGNLVFTLGPNVNSFIDITNSGNTFVQMNDGSWLLETDATNDMWKMAFDNTGTFYLPGVVITTIVDNHFIPLNISLRGGYPTANGTTDSITLYRDMSNPANGTIGIGYSEGHSLWFSIDQQDAVYGWRWYANTVEVMKLGADGNLTIGVIGSNTYTLPNVDGTANQTLVTDGIGNVSWANVTGGGGGGNVYANDALILANANLNFNNTATVNVFAVANGTSRANVAFSVNVSSTDWPNSVSELAYSQANTAIGQANLAYAAANNAANTVAIYQNGVLVLAEGNVNFNNTTTINVAAIANGSYGTNISFTANVTPLDAYSDQFYATANQTVFNLSTTPTDANLVIVTINGLVQPPTAAYTLSGTTLTLTSNITHSNDFVEVREFSGGSVTGGSSTGVPATIAGLSYWFMADKLVPYLTANVGGTSWMPDYTPQNLGYGSLCQIQTPYGAANLASNTGVTLNGLPVLTFQGYERYAFESYLGAYSSGNLGSGILSSNVTMFFVVNFTNLTGTPVLFGGGSSGGQLDGFIYTNGEMSLGDSATNEFGPAGTIVANTWYQLNWSYNLGTQQYQFRAASTLVQAGTKSYTLGKGINTFLWDGSNQSYTGLDFIGYCAEIIAYNRQLSNTEISLVESYLNSKWAV